MLWGSDKKKAAPNNEWVRANSAPAGVMWLFFRAKMDFWGLAGQRKKRVLSFSIRSVRQWVGTARAAQCQTKSEPGRKLGWLWAVPDNRLILVF